mgnify:CR=1 FL=1
MGLVNDVQPIPYFNISVLPVAGKPPFAMVFWPTTPVLMVWWAGFLCGRLEDVEVGAAFEFGDFDVFG